MSNELSHETIELAQYIFAKYMSTKGTMLEDAVTNKDKVKNIAVGCIFTAQIFEEGLDEVEGVKK